MFYIIKDKKENPFKVVTVENSTDRTYHDVKNSVFDVKGQFGRLDYAETWKDFYNGSITKEQLKIRLKL